MLCVINAWDVSLLQVFLESLVFGSFNDEVFSELPLDDYGGLSYVLEESGQPYGFYPGLYESGFVF